jgi:phosphoglucomutase
MTSTTSRFLLSNPTKATFGGKEIKVFSQKAISRDSNSIENAKLVIARSKTKLEYGICAWIDTPAEKLGTSVVKLPEGFSGVCDEIEEDEFERVGTLFINGRSWTVITDLVQIELLRRNAEYKMMTQKKLSFMKFGHDVEAYRTYLEDEDKKNGGIVTRGHGIPHQHFG